MDGAPSMSEIRQTFRTPVRIMMPKRFKSRKDWKAKSDPRQAQLQAAKMKIRDLLLSRARWRERAEHFQSQNQKLQEQRTQTPSEREPTRAALTALEQAK